MSESYSITHYQNVYLQKVRNLNVLSASLIWVKKGCKKIYLGELNRSSDSSSILLLPEKSVISFENQPENNQFLSVQLSFFEPPLERLMIYSQRDSEVDYSLSHKQTSQVLLPHVNIANLSEPLKGLIVFLESAEKIRYPNNVSRQLICSLYQQLAEEKLLHKLFVFQKNHFYHQVLTYISKDFRQKYTIEEVSEYFAMSRITLIRKLKLEGVSFKKLLLNARMNYALSLVQSGVKDPLELSLLCGYNSQQQFSNNFKKTFELSVKDYINTVG